LLLLIFQVAAQQAVEKETWQNRTALRKMAAEAAQARADDAGISMGTCLQTLQQEDKERDARN
jgi:hypothetical protein